MAAIKFNGKTYDSLEAMPPDKRQAYQELAALFADKDGNGIPDLLEGDVVTNLVNLASTSTVLKGGQMLSLQELSLEDRTRINQAIARLRERGLLNIPGMPVGSQPSAADAPQGIQPSPPMITNTPIMQEENPLRRTLLVLFVFGVIGMCALGALFFFLAPR